MKRFLFALLLFLIAASPAAAVDAGLVRGDRVAVLAVPAGEGPSHPDDLSRILARALVRELDRRGFGTVILPRSVEEMREDGLTDVVGATRIVEIIYSDGRARSLGGVGTGGEIGDVAIGGQISIIRAILQADVRLYDGRTLELLDELALDARSTRPAITAVGAGGRSLWGWIAAPLLRRQQYGSAATAIARQIVEQLGAEERFADGQ